jgi:hypothetical protein
MCKELVRGCGVCGAWRNLFAYCTTHFLYQRWIVVDAIARRRMCLFVMVRTTSHRLARVYRVEYSTHARWIRSALTFCLQGLVGRRKQPREEHQAATATRLLPVYPKQDGARTCSLAWSTSSLLGRLFTNLRCMLRIHSWVHSTATTCVTIKRKQHKQHKQHTGERGALAGYIHSSHLGNNNLRAPWATMQQGSIPTWSEGVLC